MGKESPLLTVVMPVFNALPYLDEAIASIIGQSHAQLRLAIYDDHSTDGSHERALIWAAKDSRISISRGERRLGPTGSSNAAAAMAKTALVARMDADDVMVHDRLERQLAALALYPDAVIIGSIFDRIDAQGLPMWKVRSGRVGGEGPPIAHTSILYRRDIFERVGGYRAGTDFFEDRDLYLRMAEYGPIVIVNRPLVQVRFAGQHARLSDDPESVLAKINRLYDHDSQNIGKRPYSPMAFYSIVHLAMLGNRSPRIFPVLLRRMNLSRPLLAVSVAAITALTEISPRTARNIWQMLNTVRSWAEKTAEHHEEIYIWKPSHPETAPNEKAASDPKAEAAL